MEKEKTYCNLLKQDIKQDFLCLICGKCKLNLAEILEQHKKIMKWLELENPNKLNSDLMFKNCQLGEEFKNE